WYALDPGCIDELLKGGAVFPVSIMDEVLARRQEAPLLHRHVARHLDHPRLIGMGSHAGHMDSPAAKVDAKEHVVRHEPSQGPDLSGEEVGRYEHLHMRADKFLPRGRCFPFWRGWDAVALENVAHRLGTDRQAQVGESADNPVVAPRAILPCHAHHQSFDLWVNHGPTGSLALWGAVKLLGHELPVPGQDGVRFDDLSDFLEGLLAQLLADLCQRLALA